MATTRSNLRHLRTAALVVLLGLCFAAVLNQRQALVDAVSAIGLGRVLVSAGCALAAMYATSLAWRRVMFSLGAPLPARASLQIFFASQLGKYIPGSVWGVALQMSLARDHGATRRQTATAFVIVTMLSLSSAGVIGLGCLALGQGFGADVDLRLAAVGTVLGLVALHPAVLRRLIVLGHRILRQPLDGIVLDTRSLLIAMAWQVLSWAFFGLHISVLATEFSSDVGRVTLLSTGAFALAWSVGFLVIFVPAGLGVREVALTTILAVVLTTDQASGIAIVSRGLTVASEAIWGALAIATLGLTRVRASIATANDPDGVPVASEQ